LDPVPDALLLKKSGSAGNRTRASGSVARNPDHYTMEAVEIYPWASGIKNQAMKTYWEVEELLQILYVDSGCR
jgi:hypothetical protein